MSLSAVPVRPALRGLALVLLGLLALGCGGPFGKEVASADATDGQPFDLTYEGTGEPTTLWLSYKLTHEDSTELLSGRVEHQVPRSGRKTYPLAIRAKPVLEDGPVIRTGSAGGIYQWAELPATPRGKTARVRGVVRTEPGSVLQHARVSVTEGA